MPQEQPTAVLDHALRILGEHFEHVQIMVSWNEDGLTKRSRAGCGNFYARLGLAHEFIQQDVAADAAAQLADKINPPD